MKRNVLILCAWGLLAGLAGCSCGGSPGPGEGEGEPGEGEGEAGGDGACGDGVIHANEQCDGANLAGQDCASAGFATGALRCASDCTLELSDCATCGNGAIEATEACDGVDLGGATCASVLGSGAVGAVTCAADCLALDLSQCAVDVDLPENSACDPAADLCAAPSTCIALESGAFCLKGCGATACATDEACIPLPGPGGAPAGTTVEVCVRRPMVGEVCADGLPCVDGSCTPMFSSADGDLSVCAATCPSYQAGTGQGTCTDGEACITPPAEAVELQAGDIACDPYGSSAECGVAVGYTCIELSSGYSRCARRHAVCAAPQRFFGFETTLPVEGALCDLRTPTDEGPRLCGFADGPPLLRPARASCLPLFDAVPDVGACIAVCDGAAATDGQGDLSCGEGYQCGAPLVPQLFYPQPGDVPCPSGDTSACAVGFSECVDLGEGDVCARAARVCTEEEA